MVYFLLTIRPKTCKNINCIDLSGLISRPWACARMLRNEDKLRKDFIMNKKVFGIVLVLLTIFAIGVVFAATSVTIQRTTTTVTVTNPDTKNTVEGNICIYLIHKNGINKITDDFPYKLRPRASDTYRIPSQYASDWTIYNADAISCFVIP